MDQYTVIARRYRPQTFNEVVGQEAIAVTLRNAIREERVAHAFLFSGSRGVGKTSMARILAKALNCAKGPTAEPCDECEICRTITECIDPDVVEIDAASNTGVDNVRDLRDNVRYVPLRDRFKVYIIDEAHMLSKGAWNAFLKTLEEPPPHVKFVFATTELHKVPETIRSRCQQFEFRRIVAADIVERLRQVCRREKVKAPDEVLAVIARAGQGSMRDAQSLLDQVIAYTGGAPTIAQVDEVLGTLPQTAVFDLVRHVLAGDFKALVLAADHLLAAGRDPGIFLDQLVEHFRQQLLVLTCGKDFPLIELDPADRPACEEAAKAFGIDGLTTAIQLLGDARRRLRDVTNPRILLELTLIKLGRVRDLVDVGQLVDRLERVARGDGSPEPAAGPAPIAFVPARPATAAAPVAAPAPARSAPPATASPKPAPRTPAASSKPAPPARIPAAAARAAAAPPADEDPDEAPEPAAASGEFSLDSLRSQWPRIVDAVRQKNVFVGAFVREGQPVRLDGRELTVGFGPGFEIHRENMQDLGRRQIVETAIESVLGVRINVHVAATATPTGTAAHPGEGPPATGTAPARSKSKEALDDPTVRKAQELFDARVTNVEE